MSSNKLPRRRFFRNLLGISGIAGVAVSTDAAASSPRAIRVKEDKLPLKLRRESRSVSFEGDV